MVPDVEFHCKNCTRKTLVPWSSAGPGCVVYCSDCGRSCEQVIPAAKASAFSYEPGLSGNAELEREIAHIMETAFKLWQERQRKYGMANIEAFGAPGCVVRGQDKLARLRRAYFEDLMATQFNDETINDSWLDLINYAVMGYACENDLWK